jgi:N6-adenosine-specific RNA methylase IME4
MTMTTTEAVDKIVEALSANLTKRFLQNLKRPSPPLIQVNETDLGGAVAGLGDTPICTDIDRTTMSAARQSFRCISTDPPWAENGSGKVKRGANRHYATMKTADIIDVHRRYFAEVGGPDPAGCLLWMWATSNHLLDAIEVMQALGFRYVTSMVWVKVTSTGKPHVGLGQRTRQRHELLLLGVMGKVAIPAPPDRPDSVIVAARGKHSEKPQDAYDRIQRACAGPRLEVFGRAAREGWTVVGNEAPK